MFVPEVQRPTWGFGDDFDILTSALVCVLGREWKNARRRCLLPPLPRPPARLLPHRLPGCRAVMGLVALLLVLAGVRPGLPGRLPRHLKLEFLQRVFWWWNIFVPVQNSEGVSRLTVLGLQGCRADVWVNIVVLRL